MGSPASARDVSSGGMEPAELRRTMGRYATGVGIVTTLVDGKPYGMTVNSFTSVSLEPPLVLVCLGCDSHTAAAVTRAGTFAISVLSTRQRKIALRFAEQGGDHFAGLPLRFGDHEVPVVPDALAHLECEIERQITAGDHLVVIGLVTRVCDRDGEPLAFFSGRFAELTINGDEPVHWFF